MEQWFIASKRADFYKIAATYGISPVLARLMRNRDIISDQEMKDYLYGTLDSIPSPHLLKDVDNAAMILRKKIEDGVRIRIISDYDVDGVSSNYILWNGLKRCGARVDYRIPDRVEDGYGINEHLITQAKEEGIDTIVTCDNGIAAFEQVRYATELGMTIIVTDHHDVPYEMIEDNMVYRIPEAAAVVNPKQEDCSYPFKNICGAVVAYKLMMVLYEACGLPVRETEDFLTMAALATVCDVMPLKGENRILVKEGLKRIQNTNILGLRALIEANELLGKKISCYHLGFIIGPCINASGRLKTAREAMELLVCRDRNTAEEKARALTALNSERKDLTRKGEEQALSYLESTGHCKDKVLVVYLPDCHESIAGIIAGRVKEVYNKPVFVLTRSKDGVKGSGRSIAPYHMFDEMSKIKDCFTKFGGHPMAAGLSMEESRIEEFRDRLNENTTLQEKDFVKLVHIDVALPFQYLNEGFLDELGRLEPFGNGNEKPVFAQKNLEICSLRLLGKNGRCAKMYLRDESGFGMEALYFGDSQVFQKDIADFYGTNTLDRMKRGLRTQGRIHVTYYPQVNEWQGEKTMQIVIQNYRFVEKGVSHDREQDSTDRTRS